jgi:hypothetical protein
MSSSFPKGDSSAFFHPILTMALRKYVERAPIFVLAGLGYSASLVDLISPKFLHNSGQVFVRHEGAGSWKKERAIAKLWRGAGLTWERLIAR